MGSGTSNSSRSISAHTAAKRADFYMIWATVIFAQTLLLIAVGKGMPFLGKNNFLTLLGFWFMLIAAVAYMQSYVIRGQVVRKTAERELQRTNRGMLAMGILSAIISVACLVSLIVD